MNENILFQACSVLFGDDVVISEGFLAYLQFSGLKKAYRRRVLATHPDRLPTPTHQDIADFHAVQQAFRILCLYLQERTDQALPEVHTPRESAPRSTEKMPHPLTVSRIRPFLLHPVPRTPVRPVSSIDHLYQGALPNRPLLFGHFLYYCGLTSFRTITAVLSEQKKHRLRFGELSTLYGLLNQEEVDRILSALRIPPATFGATAMALGMLSEQQVQNLLAYQKSHQRKFGTILVDKSLITSQELAALLALFRRHNRYYKP